MMNLKQFFQEQPSVALAFSGGVDSTYLLAEAQRLAQRVKAYYVATAFQPRFEQEEALALAADLGAELELIPLDITGAKEVLANPPERCYWCKKRIFTQILEAARRDGFTVLIDGTNASDDWDERPGMRALEELQVYSPLRLAGLTKEEIRQRSRELGLATWDKPAYACLATRIPTGRTIRLADLERTERAEAYLKGLGFRDLRVRLVGELARIQLRAEDLPKLLAQREEILNQLKQDYQGVCLDLELRP